ncbi:RedY protein [Streptomyces sp. NPDC050439]|uniref:RedY protein n=1 Tax=unclassified Streptomyces TaxID=2593676 RepID=UPI003430C719
MEYIVHRIKLRPGVDPKRFEDWVRETDYATCPELPSVVTFSVQRASDDPEAPFNYFEIIGVTGRDAFDRDMKLDAFHGLEEAFAEMADVVDETAGERIGAGYSKPVS